MSTVTEKPVRILFYEPNNKGRRFAPTLCPSCPHFKGESTCMIHLRTEENDKEISKIHTLTRLDLENPYKVKAWCDLKDCHGEKQPDFIDKTTRALNSSSILLPDVLDWMKNNLKFHGMDKDSYSITDNSFLKIINAIKLFREGDIDELVSKHSYIIYNSRQNTFYSDTFNRFTGLGLFTSNQLTKAGQDQLVEEIKFYSRYPDYLLKMQNIAELYSKNKSKKDAELFSNNFCNFARNLLRGSYSYTDSYWPYMGDMRKALVDLTGWDDSELPVIDLGGDHSIKQTTKMLHAFVDKAHRRLTNQ